MCLWRRKCGFCSCHRAAEWLTPVRSPCKEIRGAVRNLLSTQLPVWMQTPCTGGSGPCRAAELLTLNSDVHSLWRLILCPDNSPAEVGATVLECCFWNVELRIIVEKHPAYAILEVLNLMHGPVHPAVAAQPDGVSLLEHPLRCLEQQPAWKTQRDHWPGASAISLKLLWREHSPPRRWGITESQAGHHPCIAPVAKKLTRPCRRTQVTP